MHVHARGGETALTTWSSTRFRGRLRIVGTSAENAWLRADLFPATASDTTIDASPARLKMNSSAPSGRAPPARRRPGPRRSTMARELLRAIAVLSLVAPLYTPLPAQGSS